MPLYEYECEACGERYELIRKFSDPPLDTCPKCGKGPVRKLVSSPAFQFKGSGWYITDYARKGETEASAKAAKADGDKDAKTPSSTPESSPKTEAPAASSDKPAAPTSPSPGKPEKS